MKTIPTTVDDGQARHMKPKVLRAHILPLPEHLPRTKELEQAISVGVGFDGAWYRSQKEHWLGWLAEYNGAGAYGRSAQTPRNAPYIYNHIQCAPMLFWLAEALAVSEGHLSNSFGAVVAADKKGARQCAALRRSIPWAEIENRFATWPYGSRDRIRIRLTEIIR